jgi:peptidoglycan/LPS O-acetylase OafA/YrhL
MKRITVIDSLKVISIIIIFFHHSFFSETYLADFYNQTLHYANSLVTVFFVISGFSITLKYYTEFKQISLKKYWIFIQKRFWILFPLYILTFFLSIPVSDSLNSSSDAFGKVLTYLTMTQIYIPVDKYFFSFNCLAWYVSCLMALYLIYPFIIFIIHKLNITTTIKLLFALVLVWLLSYLLATRYLNSDFISYYWVLYIMPTGRIFNFISGIIACLLFLKTRNSIKSGLKLNILELLVSIIFFVCLIVMPQVPEEFYLSFYLMPFITILIIVYSYQKGFISKFIGNKYLSTLGILVYPFFMFHQLVIRYFMAFRPFGLNVLPIIGVSFGVTLLISSLYLVLQSVFVRIYQTIRGVNYGK